jgi:hypothetical protein
MVELEYGQYKQTYKLPVDSVENLDELKSMISPEFIEENLKRFQEMSRDFSSAYKILQSNK